MATNFSVKMDEIGRFTFIKFIRRLRVPRRSGISQFQWQKFIWDDLATLCKI